MTEKEFYTDDIEQMLKEKADQFSMYPSKRVWHSIYNNLHPGRRWPSIAICLFLIASLVFIGYLNSGQNSITRQINSNPVNEVPPTAITSKKTVNKKSSASVTAQKPVAAYYNNAFKDVLGQQEDFYPYTVVKSNRPIYLMENPSTNGEAKVDDNISVANNVSSASTTQDIIQTVNTYIKSNQIFTDVAIVNGKTKAAAGNNKSAKQVLEEVNNTANDEKNTTAALSNLEDIDTKNKAGEKNENDIKTVSVVKLPAGNTNSLNDEKAWIENFAAENKTTHNKSKGRWAYKVYVTPAVNYRKLSINTKGYGAALANTDINSSIKQKPGFGFEAGSGITYSIAKDVRFNVGLQFNYTNYNVHAGETDYPIITSVLLNDPYSGSSFLSFRTTTTSNSFNSSVNKPITLHNKTYQVSIPIGFAYKLSTKNNVDWYAGISAQPTYVFGGKANLISSDLKSYVAESSSIRSWNLNLGFETYMNFKLGNGYGLQAGPQVRYQIISTYKKNVALVEKPYAMGLKLGLTKGF